VVGHFFFKKKYTQSAVCGRFIPQNMESRNSSQCDCLAKLDETARREPTKTMATAFGVGLLIRLLPVGAIVNILATVTFSLARPVLLFLGLLKARDLCRSRHETSQSNLPL